MFLAVWKGRYLYLPSYSIVKDGPMQFMVPSPEKVPAATFLMRFSWILSSTKEAGRFFGTLVR